MWSIHILKIICLSGFQIELGVCISPDNLITRDHSLGFTKHFYMLFPVVKGILSNKYLIMVAVQAFGCLSKEKEPGDLASQKSQYRQRFNLHVRKESGHSYKEKKAAGNKVKDLEGCKCVCVCFQVIFHCRLLQEPVYCSWCYTVNSSCLFISYIV